MTAADKVRIHLVMPGDIFEEMSAAVGQRERSSFIADAAAKELEGRRDGSYRAGDKSGQTDRGTGEPVRMHAVLPADLLSQVDAEIGSGRRSVFVTEAVDRALRHRELLRLAKELAGSLANVDIPGWETAESTSQWVRNLREEADRRLDEKWRNAERQDS